MIDNARKPDNMTVKLSKLDRESEFNALFAQPKFTTQNPYSLTTNLLPIERCDCSKQQGMFLAHEDNVNFL